MNFDLDKKQRKVILNDVLEKIEYFYENTKVFSTTPSLDVKNIKDTINQFDLYSGGNFYKAIKHVTEGLEKYTVHTPHPKYFGLFNSRSNFAGIIADLITAAYNPQLAAWSHAPFAVEVEAKIIQDFAMKFGYNTTESDGIFTTGGAEANLTALLCALNQKYPTFAKEGILGIGKRLIIFCSEEAHHSIQKAAKIVGLGYDSVKTIPINENLKLSTVILESELQQLENSNSVPLMIIGTAGTTGAGTIDDLKSLCEISKKNGIWFHVDAAYGGASVLSKRLKPNLDGIERSDSITFDAHKWMSVPMGVSIFVTSKKDILGKTFRITTEYMPKEADKMQVVEPFTHSIQWSRRFIGLKVYLSLLFYGWEGYEKTINHQTEMADLLRDKLIKHKWDIKNNTALPVICFTYKKFEQNSNFTQSILKRMISNGKSWLSIYPIKGTPTFRVCISNYNTSEKEIDELIQELNLERLMYQKNVIE